MKSINPPTRRTSALQARYENVLLLILFLGPDYKFSVFNLSLGFGAHYYTRLSITTLHYSDDFRI